MLIFDRESLKIVRSKPLPSALLDQELSNATSHYILRPKRQEPRAFKSIMYLPAGWENMCIFRCIKKKKTFLERFIPLDLYRQIKHGPLRKIRCTISWGSHVFFWRFSTKKSMHFFAWASCFFLMPKIL